TPASHIAFGHGFAFAVEVEDVSRVNDSGIHVDFMIGSPELEVTGVTAAGERGPGLRRGGWRLLLRHFGANLPAPGGPRGPHRPRGGRGFRLPDAPPQT